MSEVRVIFLPQALMASIFFSDNAYRLLRILSGLFPSTLSLGDHDVDGQNVVSNAVSRK